MKRIVIQSGPKQKGVSQAVLSVKQGRQRLSGGEVKIEGPSRVVSRPGQSPAVWIETRAPVKVRLAEVGRSNQESGRPNGKETLAPTLPAKRLAQAERQLTAANVKQFHEAIRQKRQVSVRYRSPRGMRKYTLIPLDVKGGRTGQTKKNRYMWGYSEKAQGVLCLRLDRVAGVEPLEETSFEPGELAEVWSGKTVQWNLPRAW